MRNAVVMPGWSPEPPGYVTSLPRGRSTSAGQGTSASSSHRRPRSKASSDSRMQVRDVTTTELADAPRCFGTGLARAPVIEPSWTPMMQGSAWLQDVKPRGATGPRFRFEAHLRHRDPAELRGPQPQQQDGLTRFRCTIQAPPRGCFVRSTFLRGSSTADHRCPGLWPRARCRHATACMGFSINRFARWWHARDLHDRGAVSEDSITSTSPMLEGGTSSSHAGSSRWPRRSQRRADSLDGDAIQADRGSMASARSAQVASPPVARMRAAIHDRATGSIGSSPDVRSSSDAGGTSGHDRTSDAEEGTTQPGGGGMGRGIGLRSWRSNSMTRPSTRTRCARAPRRA